MLKKMITLPLIFLLTIILTQSCDTTEPTDNNLKPGRRDYTWEVDTLKIPFTFLYKMWGSSPSDVWAVGPGGGLDKTIWHYDGEEWTTDGISRPISPQCIHGFTSSNIWIAGAEGRIWNYDGENWNESLHYENKDLTFVHFKDVWGDSPNDIYAVGFGDSSNVRIGLIMHYNGIVWNRVNFGFNKTTFARIRRGTKTGQNYFIWGVLQSNSAPDTTKLFEFNRKTLKEIHSDIWSITTGNNIQVINDEVIFTISNGIYTYHNKLFNLIAKNPLENYYDAIFGRNKKDVLWVMGDGLTHYNGSDFEYLLKEDNIDTWDIFAFEKEAFLLADDESTGAVLIYHGKLK